MELWVSDWFCIWGVVLYHSLTCTPCFHYFANCTTFCKYWHKINELLHHRFWLQLSAHWIHIVRSCIPLLASVNQRVFSPAWTIISSYCLLEPKKIIELQTCTFEPAQFQGNIVWILIGHSSSGLSNKMAFCRL
jgi:hypothetical protein